MEISFQLNFQSPELHLIVNLLRFASIIWKLNILIPLFLTPFLLKNVALKCSMDSVGLNGSLLYQPTFSCCSPDFLMYLVCALT